MNNMTVQNLFSKGFPTNRIPVTIPSSGQSIILRETTVLELKSMCKTVIDNFARRNMNIIYDATTDYLQSMVLTDGVDVNNLTEFDRLYCLMIFFQLSFYKDGTTFKCQNCGTDINYRYDMVKYISKMDSAFVDEQEVEIRHKSKIYKIKIGWPKVKTISKLNLYFYSQLGEVTEEMERTQYGINYILSFINTIDVCNLINDEVIASVDLEQLDTWQDRLDIINEIPSLVVFDNDDGVCSKITGYFINRLENCFSTELCPQCHKDTYYGLAQSSHFTELFYGSLQGLYGFILQVECMLLFRYDCLIFASEQYMTYNDFNSLIHQLGTTVEKDNNERRKSGQQPLYKGLWLIREILNTMVFPGDKKT